MFACCKTRPAPYYTCVNCFGLYHKSCALSNKGKVQLIKGSAIMCCKKQEAIDSEEKESILKKTVEKMVEENDIQNKYIAKIRAERKGFAVDAMKNEELKEIIKHPRLRNFESKR
ncbi:hypothetical protein JTB14_035076 [Gonioctena quinquepunctata]|nr:hypothetical protein JTB14_035076 [Gonioctena quinquepunctata]